MVDHRLKRRSDLTVAHPQLREAIRSQIVRRLLPAIGQFFQFQATRMDRTIVACYDSAVGGHFYRHRDNVNIGALHQVTPVTSGRRYAFLAFLYGEADAALREANNAKLHQTAAQYAVESDLLFPEGNSETRRAG